MKRFSWLLGAMAVLGAFSVVLAQGINLSLGSFDLNQYFGDTTKLAVLIGAAVAFLREHLPASVTEKLKGLWVVALSVAIGAVLAVIGKYIGALSADWLAALWFGVQAGLIASGGVDLLRGILGGALKAGGANASVAKDSTTAVDAARLRRNT